MNLASDIEVLTIASLSSQSTNLSPVIAGTAIGIGGSYGNAGGENLANSDTIKLTFNAGMMDEQRGVEGPLSPARFSLALPLCNDSRHSQPARAKQS